MREILFRGKARGNVGKIVKDGEWVYGNYYTSPSGKSYIDPCSDKVRSPYTVDPETVTQYTGIDGANSVKIFEGDILIVCSDFSFCCEVVFKYGTFCLTRTKHDIIDFTELISGGLIIVGNIYDNPNWRDRHD